VPGVTGCYWRHNPHVCRWEYGGHAIPGDFLYAVSDEFLARSDPVLCAAAIFLAAGSVPPPLEPCLPAMTLDELCAALAAGTTVVLECGCTIPRAEAHTTVRLVPGAKMGCPNCAASSRIEEVTG
jgi:hypothetical protein